MDHLIKILREEIGWYASGGVDTYPVPLLDDDHQTYGVLSVDKIQGKRQVGIVVLARLADDHIIIEVDNTDRPLVDHLIGAGIPRDRIILAFAGEALPHQV